MLSQDSVGGGVVASFRGLPGDGAAMSFPQRGAAPQLPVGPPPPPGATSLLDRPLARCAALNPPLSAQQVPATTAPQLPRGPPPPPGATTMLGQTDAARGEDRQPGGSSAGPQSRDSRQGPVPDVSSSCGQGSSWPRARALPQRSLLRSSARAARKGSTPPVAGGAPLAPAVAPLSFDALPQQPEAPPKADWGSLSRYYVGAWPGPSRRLAPPSGSSAPAVPPLQVDEPSRGVSSSTVSLASISNPATPPESASPSSPEDRLMATNRARELKGLLVSAQLSDPGSVAEGTVEVWAAELECLIGYWGLPLSMAWHPR